MGTLHIRLPDRQKEQIEETAEREDYPSPSEWVRDAIREKLRRDTALYPAEVQRILNIWEQDDRGDLDLIPAAEVWDDHGV